MINLNEDPTMVLELKTGDIVTVDGIELEVCLEARIGEPLYLTTTDSRVDEFRRCVEIAREEDESGRTAASSLGYPLYKSYIKHFRGLDNVAVMERTEMFEALKTGQYTIS